MQYFINMKVSAQDLLLGLGCHIINGGQLLKGTQKLLLEVLKEVRETLFWCCCLLAVNGGLCLGRPQVDDACRILVYTSRARAYMFLVLQLATALDTGRVAPAYALLAEELPESRL
jgi:hypothetical protein